MSALKPSLKFGRRVFVIPYEKMSTILQQNSQHSQNENNQIQPSSSNEDSIQNSKVENCEEQLVNLLKNLFTSKEDFENSMALTYMLHLDPVTNVKHKQLLLYLQNDSAPPPHDKRLLYQNLDIASVPLHLIGNMSLRETLEDMRRVKDIQDNNSSASGEDSSSEELTEEDLGKILSKAWGCYIRKSKEAQKRLVSRMKRKKQ